jgi:hypothetical protein
MLEVGPIGPLDFAGILAELLTQPAGLGHQAVQFNL